MELCWFGLWMVAVESAVETHSGGLETAWLVMLGKQRYQMAAVQGQLHRKQFQRAAVPVRQALVEHGLLCCVQHLDACRPGEAHLSMDAQIFLRL